MAKDVPRIETNDPDVLVAASVYGGRGERQLRIVEMPPFAYMDLRDVGWIIENYNFCIWNYRFELFWSQVTLFAVLFHCDACGVGIECD